eukprot:Opistho-2@25568
MFSRLTWIGRLSAHIANARVDLTAAHRGYAASSGLFKSREGRRQNVRSAVDNDEDGEVVEDEEDDEVRTLEELREAVKGIDEEAMVHWLTEMAEEDKMLVLEPLEPSESLEWEIYLKHAESPRTHTLEALAKEYKMTKHQIGQIVRSREHERLTFTDPDTKDLFLQFMPVARNFHGPTFHCVTHPRDDTPVEEYAPYLRAAYDLADNVDGGGKPHIQPMTDESFLKVMKAGVDDETARGRKTQYEKNKLKKLEEEARRFGQMPDHHDVGYFKKRSAVAKGRPSLVVSDVSRGVEYQNRAVTIVKPTGERESADELQKAKMVLRNFPRYRGERSQFGGLLEPIPNVRAQVEQILKEQREAVMPPELEKKMLPGVSPLTPKRGIPRNTTKERLDEENNLKDMMTDPVFVDKLRTTVRKMALGEIPIPRRERRMVDEDGSFNTNVDPEDNPDPSRKLRQAFFAMGAPGRMEKFAKGRGRMGPRGQK